MSPTGGRQPVPRGIFAIEDQQLLLPDPIALDTSFVVEALLTTQPLHPACGAFLKRIFDSGVTVVTSDLLAVELAESAFAITLKERWGGRWRGHRTDGRSRRPATRRLNHTVMSYEALLSPVNHLPIPVRRVTADARVLMTDFGIASYDAVHAASAIAAGAEAIVTLDTGFALLPSTQLAIYTDRSRVTSCRNKRPHQHARVAPRATVSK
jgi:predicted nucleic acid-binding protein